MTREVNPVTGDPASVGVGLKTWEYALFVADDWKISRNFTLNVGLRYENFGAPHEAKGTLRNLVLGPGTTYAAQLTGAKVDIVPEFFPADNRDFAPRLGFAWNPRGKSRMAIRGGYGISYDRLPQTPLLRFRDSPPLRGVATLGTLFGTPFTYSLGDTSKPFFGYPVDPGLRLGLDPRNGISGSRVALSGVVDPNLKTAYVHNWFFGIQREIGGGMVVDVNYLGSAGHRLYSWADINRYRGDLLDGIFQGFNPSFSNIFMIGSGSNSIYQGGTVQLKRAFRQGFMFEAAYTFSKVLDDSDTVMSTTNYLDSANRKLDRALAGFDVPQRVTMVGVWEVPFLRGKHGMLSKAAGGWQLSGFVILEKGTPVNVVNNAPWPRGDFNADGTNGDRPDAPVSTVQRSGFQRSDYQRGILAASVFPKPAPGADGSLGRNIFRGPGFAQTDLSLSKKIYITERFAAQLRIDAFNVFNRVNLSNPVMDLNSNNFGRSTSVFTPRLYQAGLKITF